jgi:hypothetical protein
MPPSELKFRKSSFRFDAKSGFPIKILINLIFHRFI